MQLFREGRLAEASMGGIAPQPTKGGLEAKGATRRKGLTGENRDNRGKKILRWSLCFFRFNPAFRITLRDRI